MKEPRTAIAEAIAERTLHETDLHSLAQEIAAYLLSENRVNELESLMRDVLAYRESKGIVEASVVSAHELAENVDSEAEALLRDHFPDAKQLIIRNKTNPDIIGGLKVQLSHEQLDMSIRAKIDTFKRLTTEGMK